MSKNHHRRKSQAEEQLRYRKTALDLEAQIARSLESSARPLHRKAHRLRNVRDGISNVDVIARTVELLADESLQGVLAPDVNKSAIADQLQAVGLSMADRIAGAYVAIQYCTLGLMCTLQS